MAKFSLINQVFYDIFWAILLRIGQKQRADSGKKWTISVKKP
jgi:hypothetical protein